jgi:DNA invertase Pin-like site-specific DNA recombinase
VPAPHAPLASQRHFGAQQRLPVGRVLPALGFSPVLAAVAELERSTIRERVVAGQRAAKRRGVRFGRPTVEVDTDRALKLREQGLSWRDIAEETGVPKDTLIRHCEAQ